MLLYNFDAPSQPQTGPSRGRAGEHGIPRRGPPGHEGNSLAMAGRGARAGFHPAGRSWGVPGRERSCFRARSTGVRHGMDLAPGGPAGPPRGLAWPEGSATAGSCSPSASTGPRRNAPGRMGVGRPSSGSSRRRARSGRSIVSARACAGISRPARQTTSRAHRGDRTRMTTRRPRSGPRWRTVVGLDALVDGPHRRDVGEVSLRANGGRHATDFLWLLHMGTWTARRPVHSIDPDAVREAGLTAQWMDAIQGLAARLRRRPGRTNQEALTL